MATRPRERQATAAPPGEGRSRILRAAREIFSTSGFDGASLRQIANHAGVQHQLVVYHFKTKDALWREVISSFFENLGEGRRRWLAIRDAEGAAAALRALVREFVIFTARQPEYHRIATFEGRADNERLRWLLEEHVRPFYELSTGLIAEAQKVGATRAGQPGQIHYALIGLITTRFIFGPEYRIMTGIDPFSRDEIKNVIDLAWDFLGLTSLTA